VLTPLYGYWASDNLPGKGGIGGQGAALYTSLGTLEIVGSDFIGNSVDGGDAGLPRLPLKGQFGENAHSFSLAVGSGCRLQWEYGSGSGGGGVIRTASVTLIRDSTFVENSASGGKAATNFERRGSNSVTLCYGDVAGHGGVSGIVFRFDTQIIGSTFRKNHADGGDGADADGPLLGTRAGRGGLGVVALMTGTWAYDSGRFCIISPEPDYRVQIANSTFSNNTANGGKAGDGGPFPGGNGGTALFHLRNFHLRAIHLSLVGNEARGGRGSLTPGATTSTGVDGHLFQLDPNPRCQNPISLTVSNSLLVGNHGGFCEGAISLEGNNLADRPDCGIPAGLIGVDPVLADNGGPTLTHALLPDSSARDTADPDLCVEVGGVDQRGWPRNLAVAGPCDIGAFEYQSGRIFGDDFE